MRMPEPERRNDEVITSRIRGACRDGFDVATPHLVAIARGEVENTTPAVQIRAIDTLGRYGIGRHPELLLEKGEWMSTVAEVTARHLADHERFDAWWKDLTAAFQGHQ